MSQTATLSARRPCSSVKQAQWSPVPTGTEFEDDSPFGLQGLARDSLQIIKPECVKQLAVRLALRATRAQIQDADYVNQVLSLHPEWVDEYQVVHLIERSLWIREHSDLVMTMVRNPSQIPDNPPKKIMEALTRAYALHPEATVWYGVPLFGDQTNDEGLPLPVTAGEVRAEAKRRIKAAQEHALRWGWYYQTALATVRIPSLCWHSVKATGQRIKHVIDSVKDYWKKCRHDARRRARAIYMADLERCRFGDSTIEIPPHRTMLGHSLETACVILELLAYQTAATSPFLGLVAAPLALVKFAPLIFVPLTVVSCDPFLFVELPEEPGKLRHLGHWYWQNQAQGEQKLHLHL